MKMLPEQLGFTLLTLPEGRALVIAAAAAVALMVALPPANVDRTTLLTWGAIAIVSMTAIVSVPTIDLAILVALAIAVLQAAATGRRSFAARMRAPALAIGLLALGVVLARIQGPTILARFAAVALVAGIGAAVGTLPFIHEFDPDERTATSPVPWLAFLGPALAVAVVSRAGELVPSAAGAFGAMLIGLGLLNIVWGSVASWGTENGAAAWHYSFMADWGLALCGFGLAVADGQRAAVLVLFGILVSRLPLYLWSRQALREKMLDDRPVNLLAAAMLAGAAPFAGFAARVLLLRGASEVYWPLALVIGLGLLLWLPSSLRLGRSLGLPRGRQAVGVGVALGINVAIGVYPLPILALAGL